MQRTTGTCAPERGRRGPRARGARALLLSAAFAAALLAPAAAEALGFGDPGPAAALAGRIADAMNDQELLGQVFFLGWQGVGPSPDILRWI